MMPRGAKFFKQMIMFHEDIAPETLLDITAQDESEVLTKSDRLHIKTVQRKLI
jgi:hypothetical protein